MLTSVAFIPLVFVFGNITQHRSVFVAARMLIPVALLSVIGFLLLSRRRNGQILTLDETEKRGIIPNPTVTL
jgi:hypothetical protein